MSDTGKKFDEKVGTSHMDQMKKFKDNAGEMPSQAAAPPKGDPTNPVPASQQPPPTPTPEPMPAANQTVPEGTAEFKGVVNAPYNQPLPTKKPAADPKDETINDPRKKPAAAGEPKIEEGAKAEPKGETPPEPVAINDETVREYLKSTYNKEVESLESLFKEPEPVADPFEGYSEDVQQFLKYNKDTNRPYEDFQALNKDWDKMSPIEVARQQAIEKSGGVLNSSNVDEYLESKLKIEDFNELTTVEQAELNIYNSEYISKKVADKEKYATPIDRPAPNTPSMENMVTLDSGAIVSKEKYQELVDTQNNYVNALQMAADKITPSTFNVEFDDNGNKLQFEVDYQMSQDEKAAALNDSTDILKAFQNKFKTDKGYDLAGLQKALFWSDPKNQSKAVNAIVNKALAKFAETITQQKSNPNFQQNRMPGTGAKTTSNENPFVRANSSGGIPFAKELFRKN